MLNISYMHVPGMEGKVEKPALIHSMSGRYAHAGVSCPKKQALAQGSTPVQVHVHAPRRQLCTFSSLQVASSPRCRVALTVHRGSVRQDQVMYLAGTQSLHQMDLALLLLFFWYVQSSCHERWTSILPNPPFLSSRPAEIWLLS